MTVSFLISGEPNVAVQNVNHQVCCYLFGHTIIYDIFFNLPGAHSLVKKYDQL